MRFIRFYNVALDILDETEWTGHRTMAVTVLEDDAVWKHSGLLDMEFEFNKNPDVPFKVNRLDLEMRGENMIRMVIGKTIPMKSIVFMSWQVETDTGDVLYMTVYPDTIEAYVMKSTKTEVSER